MELGTLEVAKGIDDERLRKEMFFSRTPKWSAGIRMSRDLSEVTFPRPGFHIILRYRLLSGGLLTCLASLSSGLLWPLPDLTGLKAPSIRQVTPGNTGWVFDG